MLKYKLQLRRPVRVGLFGCASTLCAELGLAARGDGSIILIGRCDYISGHLVSFRRLTAYSGEYLL